MTALPATAVIPLVTDAHGVIRVLGSRVTLDSVVSIFRDGATAEEIASQFPTLALADIYLIIAHYLMHTAELDAHLSRRQEEAERLRRKLEDRFDSAGMRARLLARRTSAAPPDSTAI